ncbi:MAG TPA: hypothetical protein VKR61_23690, partial [Bryobacteraceae bacterium]|nr:hypothetical protein [Bryobacteraceae bacterium]
MDLGGSPPVAELRAVASLTWPAIATRSTGAARTAASAKTAAAPKAAAGSSKSTTLTTAAKGRGTAGSGRAALSAEVASKSARSGKHGEIRLGTGRQSLAEAAGDLKRFITVLSVTLRGGGGGRFRGVHL